jgi:glycosyltransferase involved in cell wall biosynthesis
MSIRQIRAINEDDWLDPERATIEAMEDWCFPQAAGLSAPCHGMMRYVEERFGARLARVPRRVIRYPFPLEEQRRELGAGGGIVGGGGGRGGGHPKSILFAGRFERRKGVHVLIRAVQLLRDAGEDVTLTLHGEDTNTAPLRGSMRGWCEAMIGAQHKPAIRFAGRLERREIATAYAAHEVVCVPSLWENFPFACLEALACGACVVGTDAGGMPEMIEPDAEGVGTCGLIARHGDAESLASQLARALGDASLRERLRAAAPGRIAALCDPSRVAEESVAFYAAGRVGMGGGVREAPPLPPPPPAPTPTTVVVDGHAVRAPAVSVIVPVYNTHQFLGETLASLRAQRLLERDGGGGGGAFTDWECIVVDDGSTNPDTKAAMDALEKVAAGLGAGGAGGGSLVRVVRAAHQGLSAARNVGVAQARGAFVLPLDSDDMLMPLALATLLEAARRNPRASFITACLRSFDADPDRPTGGWIPLAGGSARALMGAMNAASSAVALMPTAIVREVGGYDTTLRAYEDWDLYARLLLREPANENVGELVPQFLIQHRLRRDSMMHTLGRVDHHLLRARIIAKYAGLFAAEPGVALRAMLGENVSLDALAAGAGGLGDDALVELRARQLMHSNIRYRVVDKLNDAAKKLGVHGVLKRVVGRGG